MNSLYAILEAAYNLVSSDRGHSVGAYARNEDGLIVSPFCDNAVQFCSIGALIRVIHGAKHCVKQQARRMTLEALDSPVFELLREAVKQSGFDSVAVFNDKATDKVFHNTWAYALLLAKQESSK